MKLTTKQEEDQIREMVYFENQARIIKNAIVPVYIAQLKAFEGKKALKVDGFLLQSLKDAFKNTEEHYLKDFLQDANLPTPYINGTYCNFSVYVSTRYTYTIYLELRFSHKNGYSDFMEALASTDGKQTLVKVEDYEEKSLIDAEEQIKLIEDAKQKEQAFKSARDKIFYQVRNRIIDGRR